MMHKILISTTFMAFLFQGAQVVAQQPEVLPAPVESADPTVAGDAMVIPAPEPSAVTPGPVLSLPDALAMAQKRNLTYQAAREEVAKAEAQLKQAWALVLPGVQGKLTLMHRDHDDSFNFAGNDVTIYPQQEMKGVVEAGMPLINAQNWLTIQAARMGVDVTRQLTESERQSVLYELATVYLNGLTARSLIEMYAEQNRSAAQHLRVAQARFDAGTGLKIDVLRAQTDLEMAGQDLSNSKLMYDNARDAVAMMTGFEGGLPMLVDPGDFEMPVGGDAELADRARDQLPGMKALRGLIAVYEKQLDASWMQFLPTLDVGWQLSYQFSELAAMGSTDRSRWALMFTLTLPIYNHYRYGDLDYKRATLRQAMLREQDSSDKLATGVRVARRDYLSALSNVLTAQRQVELATEALKLVESSYEAGTSTSLEVTDAHRTVTQARTNQIVNDLKAQLSLLSLLKTIGEDISD